MNIALEKSQEYVSGQVTRSYGDAFIRGNNGRLVPSTIQSRCAKKAPIIFSTIYRSKLM